MRIIILIISLLIFSACHQKNEPIQDSRQKENIKRLELKYAKWFTVEYLNDYKKIIITNPWTKERYWEYRISNTNTHNTNINQLSEFKFPNKAIVLSGTQIEMMNQLSLTNKIIGIANTNYIYSPTIRKAVKNKTVIEVGDGAEINVERIFNIHPDIIFATAWDKIDPSLNTLIQQNIPIAFIMDWQEESPLARAEWIKFIAVFYNLEDKAQAIFNRIEENYLKLRKLALESKKQPNIMHGTLMSGTWYIAGGSSFAATFYKDANANYLWKENSSTGSFPLSFEAVFNKAKKADFWFNSLPLSKLNQLIESDKRYTLFNSFQDTTIYSNGSKINDSIPNPFWEKGTVNPDLILKDLISILHPELIPQHQLLFYKKLD